MATTTHYRRGYKVLTVDTRTTTFKGFKWSDLGGFGKRKFDNWLFLNNAKNTGTTRTKILYV